MIFQFTIAVFLLSCFGNYCESTGNFFTFIHEYGSTVPKRCITANCTTTTDGEDYTCVHKYIIADNEHVQIILGLKRLSTGKDLYEMLDENGTLTGDTATLTRDDKTLVSIRKNSAGQIIAVSCGTYEIETSPEIQEELKEKCVVDGLPVFDLEYTNC